MEDVESKAIKYGYSSLFPLISAKEIEARILRAYNLRDVEGLFLGIMLLRNRMSWDRAEAEITLKKRP